MYHTRKYKVNKNIGKQLNIRSLILAIYGPMIILVSDSRMPDSPPFYTAKIRVFYRKFEAYIPRKGTARPQSQFLHPYFCVRFTVYIPMIGLHILLQKNRWTDPGNI